MIVRRLLTVAWIVVTCACASAPPPSPSPPPVLVIPHEQKLAWILRLEDQRMLRDPAPPAAPVPATLPPRNAPAVAAPPPTPDLLVLVNDGDPRVRRRAALAIGRVGLAEGVEPLSKTLGDSDPEVRQIAAFALGLLGDRNAEAALVTALQDSDPVVQGRAAEALGSLGAVSAAPAVGALAKARFADGNVASIEPDDLTYPRTPPVEAFRLALYALVRLKAYDMIAAAVLDPQGQPLGRWWPIAYALQRVEDPRAAVPLMALARGPGSYTVAFAASGLGQLKAATAGDVLMPLLDTQRDRRVRVAAIRALAQIGHAKALDRLIALVNTRDVEPELRLESIVALGELRATGAVDLLLDVVSDPWPPVRAAAFRALSQVDQQTFVTVLSGIDPDPQWTVRSALATTLGGINPSIATPHLERMLADSDQRVVPAVLTALSRVGARDLDRILIEHLKKEDPVVRATAANLLGERKPQAAVAALIEAYRTGANDPTYVARAAALAALRQYATAEAVETLTTALADRDWAVRVRTAQLLEEIRPGSVPPESMRPAPTRLPLEVYSLPEIIAPKVSPHLYIDTAKGTIQIELAIIDAPITVRNFVELATKGLFNGLTWHRVVPNFVIQDGDPRGDGEGGPGYTIRDELNELPYLRGTVGMALDWRDTGGSQFFITHAPQPHLDGRYTAFGRVVSGMEVVDQLQQGDAIGRVRVWDGTTMR